MLACSISRPSNIKMQRADVRFVTAQKASYAADLERWMYRLKKKRLN